MGGPLGGLKLKPVGGFTPPDLGSKLLNWWDGTIVDDGTTPGEVDNWLDQKGTIDWANQGANKPSYESGNKVIDFTKADTDYLESHSNIAQFNRTTGEYWMVLDYIFAANFKLIFSLVKSTSNSVFFYFAMISGKVGLGIRDAANNAWTGTTVQPTGRIIIRFKQDSTLLVEVNNIDVTSENAGHTIGSKWETYPTSMNRVYLAALDRPSGLLMEDIRIHALLRIGDVLTDEEATNLYNYLNAKY